MPETPTLDQVTAAAEWKQGNRCPWNGCPSICIHAEDFRGDTLVCDACDCLWSIESAKYELERRGRIGAEDE